MSVILIDHHYLFTLKLEDGQELKLTSASHAIKCTANQNDFYEASCLNVQFATFKDNGTISVVLEGAYEQTGVQRQLPLLGCTVRIQTFDPQNNTITPFALCRCVKVADFVRSFHMYLESGTQSMRQIFSKRYSRTCRAQFGDARCKKDLKQLSQTYDILKIYENEVSFSVPERHAQYGNNYFDLGTAVISGISRVVLKHILGKVEQGVDYQIGIVLLQSSFPQIVLQNFKDKRETNITLTPGCNKIFSTCVLYDNAVNLQGEPNLPL